MKGFKLDLKKAKAFAAALENIPVAKVGVLASRNSRNDSESNASIGAKHEFGIGVPKRSFIRDPLNNNLNKNLKKAGFGKDTIEKTIEEGSLKNLIEKMGVVGVITIQDAFETGGHGKWPKHAEGYSNNTGMILIDTQQLRNSIISEVVDSV